MLSAVRSLAALAMHSDHCFPLLFALAMTALWFKSYPRWDQPQPQQPLMMPRAVTAASKRAKEAAASAAAAAAAAAVAAASAPGDAAAAAAAATAASAAASAKALAGRPWTPPVPSWGVPPSPVLPPAGQKGGGLRPTAFLDPLFNHWHRTDATGLNLTLSFIHGVAVMSFLLSKDTQETNAAG
jgi:hypothetical protein